MIQYIAENIILPFIEKQKVNRWIKEIAMNYERSVGDIAYIFCNNERILEINQQYLKHDYYTDIITFDYSEGKKIIGDIFVSIETVRSNAEEFEVPFDEELHRIIIHGILHLCGNNDKSPEQRKEMTEKENLALEALNSMI